MTESNQQQLTEEELKALREVKISLDLKGLVKGWKKLFYDAPFGAYQRIARKVEGVSKKMMTGATSIVGFPLGIILRNTSRAGYNASRGKYGYVARLAGGIAAAGAAGAIMWFGTPIVAGAIGLGFLGTAIGGLAAATVGALSVTPVFSAATLAASTAIAAGAAVFSTAISAPLNFFVGFRRSRASLKGVKLTEDQIAAQEEAFDRRSPTVRYHSELAEQVRHGLSQLPHAKKEPFYESLKAEFEAAQKASTPAAKAPASKGATPAP